MLHGFEPGQGETTTNPSMDIDEKSTAFSQAQITAPVSTKLLAETYTLRLTDFPRLEERGKEAND